MKWLVFGVFFLGSAIGTGVFVIRSSKEEPASCNAIYDGVNLFVLVNYAEARNALINWPVRMSGSLEEYLKICIKTQTAVAFPNSSEDHLGFLDFVEKKQLPHSIMITETPPKDKFLIVLWGPRSYP